MKKVLFLFVACVFAIAANAVPARRGWQTRTQADGTTIEVQQMGDEFYHYWITKDGKIAELQDDGTFIVTNQQQPTAEQSTVLRKASKRYVNRAKKIGASSMPARGLFILVNFSDKSFSDASESYYKSSLGDQTEGAKSMYNYLKLQSNGKYAPPIDVFGPVTLSKKVSYYGSNDSNGDDLHPCEMVVEACQALDSQIDFSLYDANNDGVVDNVYVIYAGKGEADGGAKTTIWPHQWSIDGEGLSCKLDGKNIYSYACSSELSGGGIYAMGTPLHEFSHVLGLPDYYDTAYGSTNYSEARTPGEWSLMDAGSYNDDGKTPPNYSIFDKYILGWDTPKVLAKGDQLDVTLTTAYGDAYQVNGGTTLLAATNTNTIYYVENRQQTGWDAALPSHGMIVWRVMYNGTRWESNDLNNYNGTTRYTVLSASGDQTNIGKTTDPFPGTKNVKTWTPFTGCALTEITEKSGTITFKYNGGAPDVDPFDITWMANGTEFTTTESTGTVVLPTTTPTACSGKEFVGWCSQANYSSATTAPTFVKAGDAVQEGATFYAVFASKDGEGTAPAEVASVTFKTADSNSNQEITDFSKIVDEESGIASYSGSKVYQGTAGVKFGTRYDSGLLTLTLSSTVKVSQVTVSGSVYGSDSGAKLKVTAGTTVLGEKSPATNVTYEAASPVSTNKITIETVNANRAYVSAISVTANAGPSYKDYSTKCESGSDIEQIEEQKTSCRKFIKDGQLFILRGDAVYDVTGARIQ